MSLIDYISIPNHNNPERLVERRLTNASGVQEIVTLKKIQWDYLDWLENKGANIERYIRNCSAGNPDKSLSEALEWWIYWAYVEREEQGLPRPYWLNKNE